MVSLVLSDVHGNLDALDAVLADASRRRFDRAVFLGDAVGYGPEVDAVASRLRALPNLLAVLGNHDAALLDLAGIEREGARNESPTAGADVTSDVQAVLSEQASRISGDTLAWLASLPVRVETGSMLLVHGSPVSPWQYVTGERAALDAWDAFDQRLALVGHTHVPRLDLVTTAPHGERLTRGVPFLDHASSFVVPGAARAIFNPGSVGQPRDGSAHASYGFIDDAKLCRLDVIRVPYDVAKAQARILDAGYPPAFASRLAEGR